jgi:hypothetical protein
VLCKERLKIDRNESYKSCGSIDVSCNNMPTIRSRHAGLLLVPQEGSLGKPRVNRTQLLTSTLIKAGGNEWIEMVEGDQPRQLVPIFQRLAKTSDGRSDSE